MMLIMYSAKSSIVKELLVPLQHAIVVMLNVRKINVIRLLPETVHYFCVGAVAYLYQ